MSLAATSVVALWSFVGGLFFCDWINARINRLRGPSPDEKLGASVRKAFHDVADTHKFAGSEVQVTCTSTYKSAIGTFRMTITREDA